MDLVEGDEDGGGDNDDAGAVWRFKYDDDNGTDDSDRSTEAWEKNNVIGCVCVCVIVEFDV